MTSVRPPIDADDSTVSVDFADFYAATMPGTLLRMRRVAGADHLAWDVTQEAYARVLQRWAVRRSEPRQANHRYTMAIAHNHLMDIYRRTREYPDPDAAADSVVDDVGYRVVDGMDRLRAVRELLDRQPAVRRAVADLYFFDELTYAEVASILRIKTSTVRTHVQRLRRILRPFVEQFDRSTDGGGKP